MPILIILALVPTLSFYFYVLAQFVMEANRRRRGRARALIVPLRSQEYDAPGASDREPSAAELAIEAQTSGPAAAQRGTEARAERKVLSTHLKNRFVVIPSHTGRLAAKRAAKG